MPELLFTEAPGQMRPFPLELQAHYNGSLLFRFILFFVLFCFFKLGLQLDESRQRDSCGVPERGRDGSETARVLFSGHLVGAADIWL